MARKLNTIKRRTTKVVITPKKKKESEVTAIGRALRAIGGLGGGYLGSMAGSGAVGASIGHGLGGQLSRWLGQGDYSVQANSLVRQSAAGVVPMMHKNNQSVLVRHKEFVAEVTGKTAFTVQRRLSINPGLAATFPWLSGVASQYSEYSIKGMVYHYVPTSGNAVSSTNAALGSVMLQTSYRANETQPASKVEMLNEYWSNEAKPSEEFCHPIECSPNENPFNIQYVRTGDVPSTDNVLLYDLGTTTLAVSGQQADDIVLGDLWVTYEIELRKPRLTDLTGESLPAAFGSGTTGITTAACFSTNFVEAIDTTTGGVSFSSSALTLAKGNVGTFFLLMTYNASTAAILNTCVISGTGSTVSSTVGPTETTGAGYMCGIVFVVTNPNTTTVVTPSWTTLTGATSAFASLVKVNPTARIV